MVARWQHSGFQRRAGRTRGRARRILHPPTLHDPTHRGIPNRAFRRAARPVRKIPPTHSHPHATHRLRPHGPVTDRQELRARYECAAARPGVAGALQGKPFVRAGGCVGGAGQVQVRADRARGERAAGAPAADRDVFLVGKGDARSGNGRWRHRAVGDLRPGELPEGFRAIEPLPPDLPGPRTGGPPDSGGLPVADAAQPGPGGAGDQGPQHAAQGACRGHRVPGLPQRQGGRARGQQLRRPPDRGRRHGAAALRQQRRSGDRS